MDVRFYDYEGNLKAIAAHRESVNWILDYCGTGTFEMHINANTPQAETILQEEYLIAAQGERQAVIVEKQLIGSDLGIFGRTVNYLLQKRIVRPFDEEETDAITAVKNHACPEYMTFTENIGKTLEKKKFSLDTPQDALSLAETFLKEEGLGFRAVWKKGSDGGVEWIFEVYEGKEIKTPISEEMRTAVDMTFTSSRIDYASHGLWRKDGTEEWTEMEKDAGVGVYREEAVLESGGEEDARRELNSLRAKKSVKSAVRKLRFGKDYNLGDILTVRTERGRIRAASKYRAVQVHIFEEGGASGEEPTFEEVSDV